MLRGAPAVGGRECSLAVARPPDRVEHCFRRLSGRAHRKGQPPSSWGLISTRRAEGGEAPPRGRSLSPRQLTFDFGVGLLASASSGVFRSP